MKVIIDGPEELQPSNPPTYGEALVGGFQPTDSEETARLKMMYAAELDRTFNTVTTNFYEAQIKVNTIRALEGALKWQITCHLMLQPV